MAAKKKEDVLGRGELREAIRPPNVPKDRVVVLDREGNPIWRGASTGSEYDINPRDVPDGWSWEWKRVTVFNMPDPGYQARLYQDGWRPVMAEHYPGKFMPADFQGHIVIRGQGLYERPMPLTQEAYMEDRRNAQRKINDLKAAHGLPTPANEPRDRRVDNATYIREEKGAVEVTIDDPLNAR